jgi:hypothetical protein
MKTISTALRLLIGAGMLFCTQNPLRADIALLNFEGFPDGTILTTQYSGVTFANATVISAGISLNESEFPPHSGDNVAFDDGGPISIFFTTAVLSFGGYFTYLEPLTLAAFDATSTEVALATSAFSTNDALFGDPGSSPNEFLQVSFPDGISSVTITGDPSGDSFVMDDATYAIVTTAVPEPGSVLLLSSVLGAAVIAAYRKRSL